MNIIKDIPPGAFMKSYFSGVPSGPKTIDLKAGAAGAYGFGSLEGLQKLGGGFKYFLYSPLLGEDSHFD